MSKPRLYVLALVAVAVTAALILFPKNSALQSVSPAALPVNGLTGGTTVEISHSPTPTAKTTTVNTRSEVAPMPAAPAAALPQDDQADGAAAEADDDVPAGAEVSGEGNNAPTGADMPKPDSDKGVALPPSEGQ